MNANTHSWTNTELQPVFDALIDQAGLSLFQLNIINSNWEMTNDNSDANVMNWSYYNTIYTNADFSKLWAMMAYLNQRGISNGVIPKVGGPGPLWMGGLSLNAGEENEYAEMVSSFIVYGRTNRQLKFNEFRAINEPDITYSGVEMSGSTQDVTVLHDVATQLNANGLSDVRYSGPDLAILNTNWMAAMENDSLVMSKTAHFGAHFYQTGGGDPTAMSKFIQQSSYPNTPWWATECAVWCSNCNNGISGDNSWAYAEGNAAWVLYLLSEGASACMIFEAFDGQYYGYNAQTGQNTPATWSFWGLMAVDSTNASPRTYTPRKQFYTYAQIAKYVRPGAQRNQHELFAFRADDAGILQPEQWAIHYHGREQQQHGDKASPVPNVVRSRQFPAWTSITQPARPIWPTPRRWESPTGFSPPPFRRIACSRVDA